MTVRTNLPPTPATTGAWSLFELRRHLVRQAGTLAARAQCLAGRGDTVRANHLAQEAERLRAMARTMNHNDPTKGQRS